MRGNSASAKSLEPRRDQVTEAAIPMPSANIGQTKPFVKSSIRMFRFSPFDLARNRHDSGSTVVELVQVSWFSIRNLAGGSRLR
jgi:hypothetical protein